MSNYAKIAVVTGAVLVTGVSIWACCKGKSASVTGSAVAPTKPREIPLKATTASSRETLREVSATREPIVTDSVYGLYKKMTTALAAGSITQEGTTPVIVVQPLLKTEDDINTLLYNPERIIGEHWEDISVFVDDRGHGGDMVLVIAYRDIIYTLFMRDETHFVAAGPLLDEVSSMGYLQLLLETIADQWKI